MIYKFGMSNPLSADFYYYDSHKQNLPSADIYHRLIRRWRTYFIPPKHHWRQPKKAF